MKKEKAKEIAETFVYFLPFLCVLAGEFVDFESKLAQILAGYVFLFGWLTIYLHQKSQMPDIENPWVIALIIHWGTFFIGSAIFKWEPEAFIGDFPISVVGVCCLFALGYHSKRHSEYKEKYTQALEENKKLREELKNGHNA